LAEFHDIDQFYFQDESLTVALGRHVSPFLFLILLIVAAVVLVNQRLAAFSVAGQRD